MIEKVILLFVVIIFAVLVLVIINLQIELNEICDSYTMASASMEALKESNTEIRLNPPVKKLEYSKGNIIELYSKVEVPEEQVALSPIEVEEKVYSTLAYDFMKELRPYIEVIDTYDIWTNSRTYTARMRVVKNE